MNEDKKLPPLNFNLPEGVLEDSLKGLVKSMSSTPKQPYTILDLETGVWKTIYSGKGTITMAACGGKGKGKKKMPIKK